MNFLVGPARDVHVRSVPILVLYRVDTLQSPFVVCEVGLREELREDASELQEVLAAFVGY